MATVKINICTDEKTKEQAEVILTELGLNMTAAMNMYLKKIIAEGGIPFELKTSKKILDYDMLSDDERNYELQKGYQDMLNGKVKPLDSVISEIRAKL